MYRVGTGEDIHRVDDARVLVLGGIIIEEGPGLLGHSDADVLLHAITDAVLGAAALGDIGTHFPSSDPRHRDADSADFLRQAAALARSHGWAVGNIDATVRARAPRLTPYVPLIRARVAAILGIDEARVSIKGKSGEGLDAAGRGEAIAATAVALLESAPAQERDGGGF